jgi:hypothetical protein
VRGVLRPWRILAPALLAVLLLSAPMGHPAVEPTPGSGLPPEAVAARDEAAKILALPLFHHRGETRPMERLGRVVMGLLRRSLAALHRVVGLQYGTALATGVSLLVLTAVAILLWRLRGRGPLASAGEDSAPQTPDGAAQEGRFLPLAAAEGAFSRGDPVSAVAFLTDWFLWRAYDPELPPGWRTNRELLPDLRSRGPLQDREWEALVAFHEALRYAGSPPDGAVVGAWLERARRVSP